MLISFIADSEITCAGGGGPPGFPSAVPACPCACLPAGASVLAAALSPDGEPLVDCLPGGASAEAALPEEPSAPPRPWAGASPAA